MMSTSIAAGLAASVSTKDILANAKEFEPLAKRTVVQAAGLDRCKPGSELHAGLVQQGKGVVCLATKGSHAIQANSEIKNFTNAVLPMVRWSWETERMSVSGR